MPANSYPLVSLYADPGRPAKPQVEVVIADHTQRFADISIAHTRLRCYNLGRNDVVCYPKARRIDSQALGPRDFAVWTRVPKPIAMSQVT
jgi:hypothetical protein